MRKPKVSVIMSVYNDERYLREAMESILAQSFTDFEFLIINDGSTDGSLEIIRGYNDHRIRIINNHSNLGLVKSLNRGIAIANGEYLARQDADDLSHPERLASQVDFLDGNPQVGLLGCAYLVIDDDSRVVNMQPFPTQNEELQEKLLWANHFCHTAAFIRKSYLDIVGNYQEEFSTAEDYDLWLRLAEICDIANLSEPLVSYRRHQISKTALEENNFKVKYQLLAQKYAIERRMKIMNAGNECIRKKLACGHVAIACKQVMLGLLDEAGDNLIAAFKFDSNSLQRGAFKYTVEGCITHLSVSFFGWQRGVEAIKSIFNSLPPNWDNLLNYKRAMLAEAYCHLAFEAFNQGDFALVRSSVLNSWQLEPSLFLMNRGLTSIFLETVLGRHFMKHARRLWHFPGLDNS
jgi:glycosyltransferase involved in cell wall biosynthesis